MSLGWLAFTRNLGFTKLAALGGEDLRLLCVATHDLACSGNE